MFKSILFAFLSLTIFSTQAMATTGNGLKAAMDEFTFAMEVEGAQNDIQASAAATEKLKKDLSSLGLSNSELIEGALAQVKNKKLAHELRESFAQIQMQNMNQEQALKHVKSIFERSRSTGANWMGSGDMGVVYVLLAFAVVIILVETLSGPGICSTDPIAPEHVEYCANPSEHDFSDSYYWD